MSFYLSYSFQLTDWGKRRSYIRILSGTVTRSSEYYWVRIFCAFVFLPLYVILRQENLGRNWENVISWYVDWGLLIYCCIFRYSFIFSLLCYTTAVCHL